VLASLALAGCRAGTLAPKPTPQVEQGTVKVARFEVPYVVEGSGRPCIVYALLEYHRRAFSDRFKRELRCAFVQGRFAIPGVPADEATPFTVDAAVEDLEAVRAALGMTRFVLVGHSIQGTVALAYALRYPDRVSHVVSINSLPELSPAWERLATEKWEREASPERKAIHERNRAALTPEALAKMSPAQAVVADMAADAAKRWYDPRFDERPLLSRDEFNVPVVTQLFGAEYHLFRGEEVVKAPVFLALGRFDFAAPLEMWTGHRARFRDLTFEVFERSGHTPQVEEAESFDARLLAWLSSR
jgi:proline iminopeptidase